MDEVEGLIHQHLGKLRVVVAALGIGVVAFAVVAVIVGPLALPEDGGLPEHALAVVCALLMVTEAVAYFLVRRHVMAKIPAGTDTRSVLEALKTFSLICLMGCAMAEGIALFGGVVVMLEGLGLNVLLVAVPFAALLVQVPTNGRWESFLGKARAGQVR